MSKSELSIKVLKEELEYFTGFYQESADFADTVNNESVHCLARFTPNDCILRLHAQKEAQPVKVFDDKEPFEVFDLGIANLLLKPVQKEEKIVKGRTQYNLRLVTVTNVPGQGTKNIIFLFSTAKRAKNWVHFVKIAQDNIGLGSISYGRENRRLSVDRHFGDGIKKIAGRLGARANDVVSSRLKELDSILSEKEDEYEAMMEELQKQTSKVEGRNENIKMKERDIQDLRKKVEEAQPQKRYRYIIPFGPNRHEEDWAMRQMTVSEETCRKVASKRRDSRLENWKKHEIKTSEEVIGVGSLLVKLAAAQQREAGAMKC
ncbi:hypothetical protein ACHWQZ_G000536 [Mnemiopsis leidyi]